MADVRKERKFIIGFIVSDEFIKQVRHETYADLFEVNIAKRLSAWCIEYYDKYGKAPGVNLEQIYINKIKKEKIPPDVAEEIEQDLLPDLSEEFVEEGVDVPFLLEEFFDWKAERELEMLREDIQYNLDKGDITSAISRVNKFKEKATDSSFIDFANKSHIYDIVHKAFQESEECLIRYPGAAGEMLNSIMVRGGFVGILAPEKRGKSWILLDAAKRSSIQGYKVALFQVGDMSDSDQTMRLAINLSKKSNKEKYCDEYYYPIKDCVRNQLDTCSSTNREGTEGLFYDKYSEDTLKHTITKEDLLEALKQNPEYQTCYGCNTWKNSKLGTVCLAKHKATYPLEEDEANANLVQFFVDNKRDLRISTHPSYTVSVSKINGILNAWEEEGWVADVILIDYVDLMTDNESDFRHRQNMIWGGLRALSIAKNALVITPTQSDGDSYTVHTLKLANYSEDKRKYSHVTAFIGLNQSPDGREKRLGILRLNELLKRGDEYDSGQCVTLLQDLRKGRPLLTSYY